MYSALGRVKEPCIAACMHKSCMYILAASSTVAWLAMRPANERWQAGCLVTKESDRTSSAFHQYHIHLLITKWKWKQRNRWIICLCRAICAKRQLGARLKRLPFKSGCRAARSYSLFDWTVSSASGKTHESNTAQLCWCLITRIPTRILGWAPFGNTEFNFTLCWRLIV